MAHYTSVGARSVGRTLRSALVMLNGRAGLRYAIGKDGWDGWSIFLVQ